MGQFGYAPEAIFYNRDHGARSININDKLSRSLWQSGAKNRHTAAEHLNLLQHFFEISGRHPDIVSLSEYASPYSATPRNPINLADISWSLQVSCLPQRLG